MTRVTYDADISKTVINHLLSSGVIFNSGSLLMLGHFNEVRQTNDADVYLRSDKDLTPVF